MTTVFIDRFSVICDVSLGFSFRTNGLTPQCWTVLHKQPSAASPPWEWPLLKRRL